ncbi:Acetylcholinesterase collagenic tail peptide [Exaiptasia diaphana]|nr:Acetylcholinesterase collagenic tail peptide [Exaiptasia diaphana]
MASSETIILTNENTYEMTRPLRPRATLESIKEDDDKLHQTHIPDLFIIPNQEKRTSSSPVSSDCRWNLPDDDCSDSYQEKLTLNKKLCLLIGMVCIVSIGAFILTILMLFGFVGGVASRQCSCSTNQGAAQTEFQRRVQEMNKMDKNVSHLTTMMEIQNNDVQKIWSLLNKTMEELHKVTTEHVPTAPSRMTEITVTPSDTPLVDPRESELSRLRTLYNDTLDELNQLKLKINNITLVPGPTGPRGMNGSRGSPGPQGPIGLRGHNGTIGPPGMPGNTGSKGPIGPKGLNGTRGPKGPQGPQGIKGTRGLQGARGPPGPRGHNGTTGLIGPPGSVGPTGLQGPQGLQGSPGAKGPPGLRGKTGAGNFSLCAYKMKISSGGNRGTKSNVFLDEPTNSRVLGTVCSSNIAKEYILVVRTRPSGQLNFSCQCAGESDYFGTDKSKNPKIYCYIHYWECPLTS